MCLHRKPVDRLGTIQASATKHLIRARRSLWFQPVYITFQYVYVNADFMILLLTSKAQMAWKLSISQSWCPHFPQPSAVRSSDSLMPFAVRELLVKGGRAPRLRSSLPEEMWQDVLVVSLKSKIKICFHPTAIFDSSIHSLMGYAIFMLSTFNVACICYCMLCF